MTMIKYDNLERDTNLGQGSELQLPSSPGRSESGQLNPESVVRDDMTMMMTTELVTMVNLVIYVCIMLVFSSSLKVKDDYLTTMIHLVTMMMMFSPSLRTFNPPGPDSLSTSC